jgi:hypothetical protein
VAWGIFWGGILFLSQRITTFRFCCWSIILREDLHLHPSAFWSHHGHNMLINLGQHHRHRPRRAWVKMCWVAY